MENFTQRNRLIKRLLWDYDLSVNEALSLLDGDKKEVRGVYPENIYLKILSSYNWYTILKIFSIEQIKFILSKENVINNIYPESLKEKYLYVRRIL